MQRVHAAVEVFAVVIVLNASLGLVLQMALVWIRLLPNFAIELSQPHTWLLTHRHLHLKKNNLLCPLLHFHFPGMCKSQQSAADVDSIKKGKITASHMIDDTSADPLSALVVLFLFLFLFSFVFSF